MNLSRAKAKAAACAALLATGVLALSGCSATGSEDTIRDRKSVV